MGDKEGVPTLNMALHDGSAVPTPLVARCEELRTKRGGLRRQRGRLRSQLQAIKEDIQVILAVPDNAEDPTVLELERREKVHEEELLVIEGELVKVEADLAECLSVRSREGSIRGLDTEVVGGAAVPTLTAGALAGLPSGVENTRDGRVKILPPVVASGGSPSSPSSSSSSSSSSSPSALTSHGPIPDYRRYSYAPDPPLAYYAGRRVRKGRILTADAVGKIRFPKLTDRFKLKAHLGAFGRLLVEAGGGIHMSSRGEERFVPVKTLECTITIAFLATLEEKEVKEAALEEVGDNAYRWQSLVDSPTKQFCSRLPLKEEYQRRLAQLRFEGTRSCDSFSRKVKGIYVLYGEVYPSDRSELKLMTRLIVGKLPMNLRKHTVDRIRSCHQAMSGGVWHFEDDVHQDWESLLPLFSTSGPSVSGAIRSACRSFEDSEVLGKDPTVHSHPTSSPVKVARIQEIENIEKSCVSVFYGAGADSKNREKVKALTKADVVYCGKNRRGKPYCIFGFRKETSMPDGDFPNGQFFVRPYRCRQSSGGEGFRLSRGLTDKNSQVEKSPDVVAHAVTGGGIIPPEIVLKAQFSPDSSPGEWYQVDAVVDTGAGLSYWLGNEVSCDPSEKVDVPVVELADGTVVNVGKEIVGRICLRGGKLEVPVSFNIFPSRTLGTISGECYGPFRVLLGREVLNKLSIVVSVPPEATLESDFPDTYGVYVVDDLDPKNGVIPLVPPPTMSGVDSLSVVPTPEEQSIVTAALNRLCMFDWRPVPYTPKFEFRFRPLCPIEIIDIPRQSVTCELKFPKPSEDTVVREYSEALRNRLSPERKRIFDGLVAEYVQRQWWTKVEKGTVDSPFKANVSLLGGEGIPGARKGRLVCDFRSANMLLPDASSFVPSTAAIFVRLMIAFPTILLVGDATAAFYHVRVYGSQMLLCAGSDVFPKGGLASSLCASEEELACDFGSDLFELVVDDYMFADRTVKVPVRDLSLWLNTLEAGGQHTPYRKFSALSTPELREELQKALSDRGVTCSIEETGKYLGVNLRFSGGSLVLVCERLARLNQAADKAEEILKSSSFTRREIFGLAGLLGVDPLLQHSIDRALADALRSVAGMSSVHLSSWDALIPIVSSPAMLPLLKWVIERREVAGPCAHRVGLPLPERGILLLQSASDASVSGGGYVIDYVVNGDTTVMLREDSWRWRANQVAWHSNYCCAIGGSCAPYLGVYSPLVIS